ncbi:helix-turn-helix domain-containing protein [Ralstonia solanacearum]|uniref:HTH cro/C1-type domain-containing protein n=1 Tax=Ralstonia solanacearum TaxID=305 RepID=A0AAD0S8Q6_RALSL|nr:helix-turn-helix transcriptional regulator [Ralstonia solanacearum]AXV82858.1 hypothetical protein CJO77_15685 [Ralstonia solanacearum]AXW53976.1 hypothetical protein CJO92_15690 [Ralstonia solanacearum]
MPRQTGVKKAAGNSGFHNSSTLRWSGLHRTYISQVERAVTNITLDNLQRIATVLDVEPADLLRELGQPN